MASADREILGHLVRYKTNGQPAEWMAAAFQAIEEWLEMKVFKKGGDGLECSYRKGLILVWLYVVWCLQCCLHFSKPKIQTAEGTLLLRRCETQASILFFLLFYQGIRNIYVYISF